MAILTWDAVGDRTYETGTDHGVLFVATGATYGPGVAWNGLTAVTESPSGAEATAIYADNIKYFNLISAEDFGGTIEAYDSPPEFDVCDGSATPVAGVSIGQQTRRGFGFSYRTLVGNDTEGNDYGYKLHLVYGAQASVSEKAYTTVNDTPEPTTLSWEFSTTPVPVTGLKPTAIVTVDSTTTDPDLLAAFEAILYGSESEEARLPLPDEVVSLLTPVVP